MVEQMGFLNKVFKEDKSQELFEKNNIDIEEYSKMVDYFVLTLGKRPKDKNITQEMINEYKYNIKLLNDINLYYFRIFLIIWNSTYEYYQNLSISVRKGYEYEYSKKVFEFFKNKILTQEIVDGFKTYSTNVELLDNCDMVLDVDSVFREFNKPDIEIMAFLDKEKIYLTEKILTNEDLIKIMEYKIKMLLKDIDGYSHTALSSSSSKDVKKIHIMKAKANIDVYQGHIAKLSNKQNQNKDNMNSDPDTMYCQYCGSKIPKDSKFCKECGEKL